MNETPPPPPAGTIPPPPPPPGEPPPPPPPTEPPSGTVSTGPEPYPVDLSIEYQDRELNRTTTFFRVFTVIPIAIIVAALSHASYRYGDSGAAAAAGAIIVLPTALMIIFREKYPRWWFDFNKQMTAFLLRVATYFLLIEDRYPSTDEPQGVQLTLEYPNVTGELNRYMPIIKWFLAIPHFVVLFFLGIGVIFATIFAWFSILFTGRYPKDVFEFVEGVLRWNTRVSGYAFLLVTDRYPPFSLSE